jgi:hypothetical protein
MPRRVKLSSKNKSGGRMRQRRAPNVPTSAVRYQGPLNIPSQDSMTVALLDGATISSSIAGLISGTFNNNPSGARNFTEFSTSWLEYRVLGIKITYYPITITPNLTLQTGSGSQSVVHGTVSTAPTSLSQAFSTGVARPFSVFKPFSRQWRMSTINEAVFVSTAAPASTSDTFVLYADNATISQVFGNLLVEYITQFKTHRL